MPSSTGAPALHAPVPREQASWSTCWLWGPFCALEQLQAAEERQPQAVVPVLGGNRVAHSRLALGSFVFQQPALLQLLEPRAVGG